MTLNLALLLALAEPSAAAAPQPEQSHPQSQISLAEVGRAIAAGRLDQAKSILGVAMAAGAKGEPVDRLLADLSFARGENEQALTLYKTLIAQHPDELLLLERAGIAALRLGRVAESIPLLDRATRQPQAGWRSWNARGIAADRQGRWDEANAAYAQAMALDPSQAEVANNHGWSMMLQGRWTEALANFERAAAINPKLPRLANNIELARAAVGADLPQRLTGEDDEAYAARLNDAGVVAAASGQTKKAEAAFARAIDVRARWYARAAENLAALGAPQ